MEKDEATIEYNPNITIILGHSVEWDGKLAEDEYYALMVEDRFNKHLRPRSDYFDYGRSWIGLERTSAGEIYISKDRNRRDDRHRGLTQIVRVKDVTKCCILDY